MRAGGPSTRETLVAAALALAIFAVAAAPASAVNRFASPTGTGTAGTTSGCTVNTPPPSITPCSLANALPATGAGDDLTLLGGLNYPNQPTQLAVNAGATVHGTPGSPVTIPSSAGTVALSVGVDATLRDVRLFQTGGTGQAAVAFETDAAGERVYVDAGNNEYACGMADGALLRDSVCLADAGSAVYAPSIGGADSVVTLRNVTAIAPAGNAIYAVASGLDTGIAVRATNVIAQGNDDPSERDIFADENDTGSTASVVLDHSNYTSWRAQGDPGAATVTPPSQGGPEGNVLLAPVFVNPANGDYRQATNSAGTIDRGTAASVNGFGLGPLDLGGATRCTGDAPDIGADELAAAACGSDPPVTDKPKKKKCKKKKRKKSAGAGAAKTKKKCKKKRKKR